MITNALQFMPKAGNILELINHGKLLMAVQEMMVYLTDLQGKTLSLIAKPSDTVEIFKHRVEDRTGAMSRNATGSSRAP